MAMKKGDQIRKRTLPSGKGVVWWNHRYPQTVALEFGGDVELPTLTFDDVRVVAEFAREIEGRAPKRRFWPGGGRR